MNSSALFHVRRSGTSGRANLRRCAHCRPADYYRIGDMQHGMQRIRSWQGAMQTIAGSIYAIRSFDFQTL
jgi:hypothetical protein